MAVLEAEGLANPLALPVVDASELAAVVGVAVVGVAVVEEVLAGVLEGIADPETGLELPVVERPPEAAP